MARAAATTTVHAQVPGGHQEYICSTFAEGPSHGTRRRYYYGTGLSTGRPL